MYSLMSSGFDRLRHHCNQWQCFVGAAGSSAETADVVLLQDPGNISEEVHVQRDLPARIAEQQSEQLNKLMASEAANRFAQSAASAALRKELPKALAPPYPPGTGTQADGSVMPLVCGVEQAMQEIDGGCELIKTDLGGA